MKQRYLTRILLLLSILFISIFAKAQQNDDLINILLKKNIISQKEADSIRADQAVKEQARRDKENQHGITIGSRALQLSGLVQTEYEGFQQSTVPNTFLLHRARLDVKGDIDDNWNYEVYTEFATTTKLLDAYTTYKIADFLKISAGQFKVPYSLESLIADSQLEFIDRSQVVNALAGRSSDVIGNQNGRDIGAEISGSFAKLDDHYLFDYTLGVFNGAGYDVASDNNGHKDIVGRFTIHPIKNLDISGDFYDGQGNYGTPAKNYLRNRGGFDARYVTGGLSVTAEYDKGTDGLIKRDGYFVQAAYFVIPKHLQLAAKYDTYDPNKVISTDRTRIYTGGINYFFNNWAKFTIDYLNRREETAVQVKNNILEVQLQLAF
ncbi:porin [Mucilaginibacter sp.]|uniref:porin n=1 Tax=Mucilaginibacter sp. TaxID=1882438 RepID=UPI0028428295|nr:porin [Mucilaginibacter sp.]MDR3695016.1 porin [Mucilaginibacter sp.]